MKNFIQAYRMLKNRQGIENAVLLYSDYTERFYHVRESFLLSRPHFLTEGNISFEIVAKNF